MLANTATFNFELIGNQDVFHVLEFNVDESVASLYSIELLLATENQELDFDQVIAKSGVLTLLAKDQPSRLFHGEVVSIAQEGVGKRLTNYRLTLAPKFWFLQHRAGCRIFQDKNVIDIIKALFTEANITNSDYRLDLKQSYGVRNYCTQYHESDFHFLSRLMEEEGLLYFFEHQLDRQVMVITDHGGSFKSIQHVVDIPFHEKTSMRQDHAVVYDVGYETHTVPNEVVLSDFNFEKPQLALLGQASVKTNSLSHYHYPGRFNELSEGKRYAKHQLLAHRYDKEMIVANSDSLHLAAGCLFSLKEHPDSIFNQEYKILETSICGKQPQSLEEGEPGLGTEFYAKISAIPNSVDYKSPAKHQKHLMESVQTALVVGPAGEEIYTDQFGRIKVQFHWDREGQFNEASSCWVRVQRTSAGNEWGSLAIPRVGQEVVVSFMDGDPDRPLVTGAIYHGVNQPPFAQPKNKTQLGIKTQSYPGGGGYHELRIDDRKGSEQVYLHAEKDFDTYVNNDLKLAVENDKHTIVENSFFEQIDEEKNTRIGKDFSMKTGAALSQSVGKDLQQKVGGSQMVQAGKDVHQKAGKSLVVQAGMAIHLKGGSGKISIDPSGVAIVGPMVKINSGGSAGSASSASPQAPKKPESPKPEKAGKTPSLKAMKHRQREGVQFGKPQ